MNIETKLNIIDTCYYLHDNKVVKDHVMLQVQLK